MTRLYLHSCAMVVLTSSCWFSGFALLASAQEEAPPAGTAFRAGFAERDITPEIGMEQPGGYGKSYHRTLHDPCKVRAAVFDDGTTRVALVGLDALGIRRDTVEKVRQEIESRCGIPGPNVLISASHSHSSGPLLGVLPGEYDHASPLAQRLAYDESTGIDLDYLAKVEKALIEAVVAADERKTDALAGAGYGVESEVAFNRRFKMRDGRTLTHPGLGNPDIVEPAGPIDPQVGVVGAWSEEGKILGCIVNFACHATTNPGGISANYVHWIEKVLHGYYGPECVVVFLPGAAGDVTQVDNRSPYANPKPEIWAERVGGRVGAEVLKVLMSMERGPLVPVVSKSRVWQVERRVPTKQKVEEALKIVQSDPAGVDPTVRTFAKETVLLDAILAREGERSVTAEVQVVQLGPAIFVSDPAEYFCRYGLEIKRDSGFPFTFPVSLANGCVGYVPTKESFDADGGGYETRLTSYSNLRIDAGNQFRDVGIELAKSLTPGAAPEPPARPPFGGSPWGYGNAAPEIE
jgi:hypothetical protein